MISVEKGTVSEIADEAGLSEVELIPKLNQLLDLGYLGILEENNKSKYFRNFDTDIKGCRGG